MGFTCIFENDGDKSCKNLVENEFCILPREGGGVTKYMSRCVFCFFYLFLHSAFKVMPLYDEGMSSSGE